MLRHLQLACQRGAAFTSPEEAEPSEPAPVLTTIAPELEPVARALLDLIGRALGLASTPSPARTHLEQHLLRTQHQFAGRRVQGAQVDGAIRLLAMLQANHGTNDDVAKEGRGAFLADEAGLGKSIIAQMVAFGLLLEKALDPRRPADALPRLSILAPRQLVVAEVGSGADSGQWQRHRTELLDELLVALTALADAPDASPAERQRAAVVLAQVEQEARTSRKEDRQIRVFSQSTLQRTLSFDGAPGAVVTLADHAHIAASEIVVLDESHNLRNGSSSRTRLARFLLTLPVPGESWPVFSGEHATGAVLCGSAAPLPGGDPYARCVLCLTATPFNNAFDDLVTQIGHFARCQAWPQLAVSVAAPELPSVDHPLAHAMTTWAAPCPGALDAAHVAAFTTLLRQVAEPQGGSSTPHLRSGRRLDPDPLVSELQKRTAPNRDGGPIYRWPDARYQLDPIIGPVAMALAALTASSDDADSPSETDARHTTSTDEANAIQRLDALLGSMFVQRSRARVIRLMSDQDAAAQFRAPKLPRRPLALNPDASDSVHRHDVSILEKLFAQLGAATSDGLALFAYEISTLRGGVGAMGSGDQKSTNLLGFQRMQLIKRLQSSRYAFGQTLLRGPLRRSLIELAVVDHLAGQPDITLPDAPDDWRSVVRDHARQVSHTLTRTARDTAKSFVLSLALNGGTALDTPAKALRDWIIPATTPADQVLRALLGDASAATVREAVAPDADPAAHPWLHRLLVDLTSPDSRLIADIDTCLDWAFQASDFNLSALVPLLQESTMATLRADVQRSGGARGPLSALRRHLQASVLSERDLSTLRDWLLEQLREPRIRGLVGWLLAQTTTRAKGLAAAAGHRSLVFSEYTDSLDYVAVVLQALSYVARDDLRLMRARRGTNDLASVLYRATQEAVTLLHAQANEVAELARGFAPPLPTHSELFGQLDEAERDAQLLRLSAQMSEYTGLRTGEGAARLAGQAATLQGPESLAAAVPAADAFTEEDEVTTGDGDSETEALVDAFAPWYRVDPIAATLRSPAESDTTSPEEAVATRDQARSLLKRLRNAAAAPLYTLLATEVLAEGVNLQECGVVVHFDLPWNPTRLIQRNGRVDRRIQAAYEDAERRQHQWERLHELAGEAVNRREAPPQFLAPRQVFHLTVIPPEPDLDVADPAQKEVLRAAIESVRRTLFRKLRGVQTLFGLTSWPIVLRQSEAQEVLGGEIDVETPGFRRREELFARRSDLRTRLGTSDGPPPRGAVTLRMPLAHRVEATRALGGDPTARGWSTLREVGVQSWSGASPGPGRPVHAGLHWQVGQEPPIHALTAWALCATDREASLVRWATRKVVSMAAIQRTVTVPAIVPAVWTEHPEGHDAPFWLLRRPVRVAPGSLEAQADPTFDLRTQPISPTDAAEDLLNVVAEWLLREGHVSPSQVSVSADEGAPTFVSPPGSPADASDPLLAAWRLVGRAQDADAPPGKVDFLTLGAAAPATAINLRVVFDADLSTPDPA